VQFHHLNRRFIDTKKSHIFGWSRSRKCSHSAIRRLEPSLFRLHRNRILGWSISSHYLATTRKVAFFTSPKSHFTLVQMPKINWKSHMSPWKLSFRHQQSRILGWSRGRKWVQSDMRDLETSLSRLHPSRILGWSRGKKWVLGAWWTLEKSISRLHQSWILGLSIGRIWLLIAIRPLESSLYRHDKSRIFGWSRSRKCLQSAIRQLETTLFRLHPNRILGWSRGRKWARITLHLEKSLFYFSQASFEDGPHAEN